MSIGLVLEETMSGWLKLEGDKSGRPFSFTIRAFTEQLLSLGAPRAFRGVASIGGVEVPVSGVLTIRVTGPRYELDFVHPEFGPVHVAGEKTYRLKGLLASLVTCPLTVYRNGQAIGTAEVAYRDSMLTFPFKALKLVKAEQAFGRF
jgi:hypothetical protein